MIVTIERAALLGSLARILSATERKTTIPILGNVLLKAEEDALVLTGTDMEIAVTSRAGATVRRPGVTTVPAATLSEIVRRLPDKSVVTLEHAGGDAQLSLRAGKFATSLMTLDPDDFPAMTSPAFECGFTIQSAVLGKLIERTRFAVSTEETRYYLNGLYFHIVEGGAGTLIRAVATDGHRLAMAEADAPFGSAKMPGVIVPRKTIAHLLKMSEDGLLEIDVGVSETRIQMRSGATTITSKLIDGSFPDYRAIIPTVGNQKLTVTRKALLEAVGRVSAVSSERSRPIKLELSEEGVGLSSSSPETGTAHETLDPEAASYVGHPETIGFQARYVDDIASQVKDRLSIFVEDAMKPVVVHDDSDPDCRWILMPMRV